MERTKGKLFTSEHEDNQDVVIRTDKNQRIVANCEGDFIRDGKYPAYEILANAEHLVKCWNAFEEGGSLSTIYKLIDEAAGDICEAQMNKTKFDSLSLARQKLDRAQKIIKLAQAEAEK